MQSSVLTDKAHTGISPLSKEKVILFIFCFESKESLHFHYEHRIVGSRGREVHFCCFDQINLGIINNRFRKRMEVAIRSFQRKLFHLACSVLEPG